jgi:hypothetical protein
MKMVYKKEIKKLPLYERVERLISEDPEKVRKGLKLFARVTKYSNEELRNFIEKARNGKYLYEKEKKFFESYSGLMQSVLYEKVKKEGKDWRKAYKAIGGEFDLPYGGAFITADQDGELKRAVFSGFRAVYKAKFCGNSVERAKFSGEWAGYQAKFYGNSARGAVFSGVFAGEKAIFYGNSARGAVFSGEWAGYQAKFYNKSAKEAVFSGEHTGYRAKFYDNSAESAKFSGWYAGEEAKSYDNSVRGAVFSG